MVDSCQDPGREAGWFQADAFFRAAFQTSPDAINLNRLSDGIYVDVNDGFTALTGWHRDEVIGRPPLEVGIWADPSDQGRLVEGLRAHGAVTNLEARFGLKDGRIRTGLLSARIFELDGVRYILSVTRDIEDWKNAQAGYSTFLTLVENSNEFVSISTLDARVVYVNRAGRQMVGLDAAADVTPLTIGDFLEQSTRDVVTTRMVPGVIQRGILTGENRLRHFGTGHLIEVEYSIFALDPGNTGPTGRMAVVARDISERKSALQRLAAEEARYRQIFENIVDVYIETGLDGVIFEVSPSIERVFGYTREEAVGRLKPTDNYVDPGARDEIARRVAANGFVADFEVQIRHKDGHGIPCSMSTRPLPDPDGGPMRFVSMIRDISERKRSEAERKRLEEQLREAHRLESIGRLAGGVAHDFNNLLTPIIGYSDLLLLDLPDTHPMRSPLEHIRSAGVRGKDLAGQLLAFGRRQVLQMKVADLNALVGGVQPMLTRLIREDLSLQIDLVPGELPVQADPSQVDQVLVNLAMNAQDAMSRGGRLGIRTSRATIAANDPRHPGAPPGTWAMLEVSDTGHGMDAITLARVFEPFFTTKRTGRGTGLGLATSYGVVKQHGGHIGVLSTLGQGTTFRVYLPLVEPSPGHAVGEVERPPASAGGETLLLVEDEPIVRQLARSILESHGYHVLEARDGEEAERRAAAHPGELHLLVTDVILPGANGRQLYAGLGKIRPGLRVLYMSGYMDDVIARHGVLEPGVRFLQKPFSVLELTRQVREALDAPAPDVGDHP